MSAVNRCSSEAIRRVAMLCAMALLAACRGGDVSSLDDGLAAPVETAAVVEGDPHLKTGAVAQKAGEAVSTFTPGRPGDARCRILFAAADLDAMTLRSPTISAGIDNDGDGDVSISYDVLDTRRARLTEELAEARCRRHIAAIKLRRLLVTSPLALTRTGYVAKANSLKASRAKLALINRQVKNAVARGDMTAQQGMILRQQTARVRGQEAKARGEAARREVVDRSQARSSFNTDIDLVAAERDVARLSREMRTANAFTFTVSGGYSTTSDDDAFFARRSDGDDLYAKVKMSVRTGALRARRAALEDELEQARIDGLSEEETGVFWRAEALRTANAATLRSLVGQRQELAAAMAAVRRNRALASGSGETDLIALDLRSRVDSIAYAADIAGLDATIADTRRLDSKLRFRN